MRRSFSVVILIACLIYPRDARAYGVLAHEAIIDAVWDDAIVPLLRARFRLSGPQLTEAKAFAYGGAIIQDSGYYPLSSRTFGNLTHYVRSGDFITAMLATASDANEYAFALGALAHYAADNGGHPKGINPAVPIIFPKVGAKFGSTVTYEDNPTAHLRTEFGFDVVQVARGAYAPTSYHDFIGFEVSKPVLARAFRTTYGLDIDDVFGNYDVAIGTFRWAVSQVVPALTKAAWSSKRKEIEQRFPDATRQRYVFMMTRYDFERDWGTKYRRPNMFHRLLGWTIQVLPKIGPLRSLAFKPPTPEAEQLFLRSFNDTVDRYRELLRMARAGPPRLANLNFDTGRSIRAGDYRLVDETYEDWLALTSKADFANLTPQARANLLAFYANLNAPIDTKRHEREWQTVLEQLKALRSSSR